MGGGCTCEEERKWAGVVCEADLGVLIDCQLELFMSI